MKKIDVTLGAVGVGLLLFVGSRIGWTHVLSQLSLVWVALPFVLVLSLVRLVLQTASWKVALRAEGLTTNAFELMRIRLASQSMGYLSTFGPTLSEPMKVRLLGVVNWKKSTTATIADTGVYWFAASVAGLMGCAAAAIILVRTHYSIAVLMTAALFALFLALLLRRAPVLGPVARFFGARTPAWLIKAAEIETQIRSFRERHARAARLMMTLDLVCQALLIAEAAVVIACASVALHPLALLGIEAAVRITKIFAGWLPGRIGADEGGTSAAFAAFGLSPAAGLMLALVRRCRDLLWCAAGLAWLAWKWRQSNSRVAHTTEVIYANGYRSSQR